MIMMELSLFLCRGSGICIFRSMVSHSGCSEHCWVEERVMKFVDMASERVELGWIISIAMIDSNSK